MVARQIIQLIDHFLKINYADDKQASENSNDMRYFDFDRLKQISLGDEVFEKDLLTDYFADAEQKINILLELLSAENIKKIVDVAHTLKGSSYSVGAKLIGDEALGIELSARNDDLGNVEERIPKLSKSIKETKAVLKNKI